MTLLDEITAKLGALPEKEREQVVRDTAAATSHMRWIPNPGPQTDAYFSKADCLLYGGEPGGGKSQLLLGLAFNEHRETMLFRREYGDLERLIEDALKIHGSRDGFNGSPPPRLRVNDKQTIRFRAAQRVGDEKGTMGHGRDLLGIDEATHFAESQVRFLMGWVRTEFPGQRTRTVLATNPPLTAEGLWVTKMFAPWLDETFPDPAKPGELRWVVSDDDGNDKWVEGPGRYPVIVAGKEKMVKALSRTYIPASVKDNPYYAGTEYEANLDAMTEPYRSLLMGGFHTSFKDQDRQVIPTDWIRQAQERWKPEGWRDHFMTAMGFDPAGGGEDPAALAFRHGGWFGPLETFEGEQTADGSIMAAGIIKYRRNNCPIVVDMGGGYGGQVTMRLKDNSIDHRPFNGANTSTAKTRDGQLGFWNKRAEAWWKFKEELDPDQEGGSTIALPPDPELLGDLAAPTYKVEKRGIKIESKDDIKKRLGRSTNKGDAVVMCLSEGNLAVKRKLNESRPLKVVMGHSSKRRRRA